MDCCKDLRLLWCRSAGGLHQVAEDVVSRSFSIFKNDALEDVLDVAVVKPFEILGDPQRSLEILGDPWRSLEILGDPRRSLDCCCYPPARRILKSCPKSKCSVVTRRFWRILGSILIANWIQLLLMLLLMLMLMLMLLLLLLLLLLQSSRLGRGVSMPKKNTVASLLAQSRNQRSSSPSSANNASTGASANASSSSSTSNNPTSNDFKNNLVTTSSSSSSSFSSSFSSSSSSSASS